jgi:hypothetical protein
MHLFSDDYKNGTPANVVFAGVLLFSRNVGKYNIANLIRRAPKLSSILAPLRKNNA